MTAKFWSDVALKSMGEKLQRKFYGVNWPLVGGLVMLAALGGLAYVGGR